MLYVILTKLLNYRVSIVVTWLLPAEVPMHKAGEITTTTATTTTITIITTTTHKHYAFAYILTKRNKKNGRLNTRIVRSFTCFSKVFKTTVTKFTHIELHYITDVQAGREPQQSETM